MAVDAPVVNISGGTGDDRPLAAWNRNWGRVLDGWQTCSDIGDEIGNLLLRDHRPPDRPVWPLRIRRFAKPVRDDLRERFYRQTLSDRIQGGHEWGNAAPTAHPMTGGTGELDKIVSARRHVWIDSRLRIAIAGMGRS